MIDKGADAGERLLGFLNHVFEVNFEIIGAHSASVAPSLADNPFPENCGSQQAPLAIPRKRLDPANAVERDSYIPAITDGVNDECIGEKFFYQREIEQMEGCTFRPPLDALLMRNRLHYDAQKIAGIAAFVENPRLDFLALQAGAVEQFTSQPVVEQFATIFSMRQVSKTKAD